MAPDIDPRKLANEIMDSACLPEVFAGNGVDKAIRDDIVRKLEMVYVTAFSIGRQHGREELQRSLRSLLGFSGAV